MVSDGGSPLHHFPAGKRTGREASCPSSSRLPVHNNKSPARFPPSGAFLWNEVGYVRCVSDVRGSCTVRFPCVS